MSIELKNENGSVFVSDETIASIVGVSALEVYGLVGMASKKIFKDGVFELLKKENITKGVVVIEKENDLTLEIYVVIQYGVKISEVARNIQEKVRYAIKQMLNIDINNVNVFVQGVKVNDETKKDR